MVSLLILQISKIIHFTGFSDTFCRFLILLKIPLVSVLKFNIHEASCIF